MKIICQQCAKHISIDDSFAGGVCRCPYCKATNHVPGDESGEARPARPDAPVRAAEPIEPDHTPAHSTVRTSKARRTQMQGIVAIVGIVALLALVAVVVYFVARGTRKKSEAAPETSGPRVAVNPFEGANANVLDMPIGTPVVYVLDSGNRFEMAGIIACYSILSLPDDGKFQIIAWEDSRERSGPVTLADDWVSGGTDGYKLAFKWLAERFGAYSGDSPAFLAEAIKLEPKCIVYMTRDCLSAAEGGSDFSGVIDQCKRKGVRICTIAMNADSQSEKNLAALAEATGGQAAAKTESDISRWMPQTPLPPYEDE